MMHSEKAVKAITAAIELFGKNGFDNTSTQSIAKHAGIGNATLFKYFETKDVLIRTAYFETKKKMIEAIKVDLDPSLEFEPLLRKIWSNMFEWILENPLDYNFTQQIVASRYYDPAVEELVDKELFFFKVAINTAIKNQQILELPLELIQSVMMSFLNLAVAMRASETPVKEQEIYQLMLNSMKIK